MRKRQTYIIILLAIVAFTSFSAQSQTTVWIVRHAEKELKTPFDPGLSLDGQDRAKDLASLLRPNRLLAVYATSSKVSKQTAQPTAYGHGLNVTTYNPDDPAALASSILRQHKNGGVAIIGDANTVLELVEAFGIKRPIPDVSDDHYDYVFTITVNGNSIGLLTSQYGKLHRARAPK